MQSVFSWVVGREKSHSLNLLELETKSRLKTFSKTTLQGAGITLNRTRLCYVNSQQERERKRTARGGLFLYIYIFRKSNHHALQALLKAMRRGHTSSERLSLLMFSCFTQTQARKLESHIIPYGFRKSDQKTIKKDWEGLNGWLPRPGLDPAQFRPASICLIYLMHSQAFASLPQLRVKGTT